MKVNTRCNLLRRLASTKWGAHFDVLQTSTTALAFASAEYCSPVWCRSAHTHRLDAALNNGLRLVSGCIRSTPTFTLPVVSRMMPTDINRNKQCLVLSRHAEADDHHTQHDSVTTNAPARKRLRSRHSFSEQAKQLTSDAHGMTNRCRSYLENKMGHHTLPINGTHPYSRKQTYRTVTRSTTTLASAPEPYKNMLWQI